MLPLGVQGRWQPEIGVDVARFGDDFTCLHVRCGPWSLHHERHNGWGIDQTRGRCKMMCREFADWYDRHKESGRASLDPKSIIVKVDEDGLGGGVLDDCEGYTFIGVHALGTSREPENFPNVRSELWFSTAALAEDGGLYLGMLPAAIRRTLKRQCLAVQWKMDGAGRCAVERKEELKKRVGYSPDDADAMNLAYWPMLPFTAPPVISDEHLPSNPYVRLGRRPEGGPDEDPWGEER